MPKEANKIVQLLGKRSAITKTGLFAKPAGKNTFDPVQAILDGITNGNQGKTKKRRKTSSRPRGKRS